MSHLSGNPLSPIASAIEFHRLTVIADEANFSDDYTVIDQAAADISGPAEAAAFQAVVSEPCTMAADVQAKLRYFLDGTIGERSRLVDYLFEETHGADPNSISAPVETFPRSLVLPA